MSEIVYHHGHYHRSRIDHRSHERPPRNRGGVWQRTYEVWEEVLYGIGSVYYKIRGR